MIARTQPDRITFAVDPVARATTPLASVSAQEALRALIGSRVEACSSYAADCIGEVYFHPLLAAADFAFNQHRPLVLSPDMIWVTIVQGAARHVINNAERLRPLFVEHEGRLRVEVEQPGLHPGSPENAWDEVIHALSVGIRGHLGATYYRLGADFGTTGPVERLACEVALLDMFQPYFEYEFIGICGIPEVTLEGTVADWQRLRAKVDHLAPYDLDWWLPSVRAICDQFARAAAGDVDRRHWRDLYKQEEAYGGGVINGWLVKLIPYLKGHRDRFTTRNPLLADPTATPHTSLLPSGVSQVPFRCRWTGRGEDVGMELLGGFVGVTQDPATLALRPKLGWAVRPLVGVEQTLMRLGEHEARPPLDAPDFLAEIARLGVNPNSYVEFPSDFIACYQRCNGADLTDRAGTVVARLRRLEEIEALTDPEPPPEPATDASIPELKAWKRQFRTCRIVALVCDLPDGSFIGLNLRATEAEPAGASPGTPPRQLREVVKVGPAKNIDPAECPIVAWSFEEFLRRVLDGEVLADGD